jgi:hypothetical protein
VFSTEVHHAETRSLRGHSRDEWNQMPCQIESTA